MQKFAGLLAAAILAAGAAMAQDSGTDPNAGAANDGTGFVTGTPATGDQAAQADPLKPFVRETIGDWQVECRRLKQGDKEKCQLHQLLRLPNGTPVIEVSLGSLPPGQAAVAGAIVVTPLETLLLRQLTLTIDGGEAKHYPFAFCNQKGCIARVGFTAPELAELEKGKSVVVTIYALGSPQNPVEATLSLKGFSKAYDSILN